MTERFTTNGYYIFDTYKDNQWLLNEVEAQYIVDKMNNLDTKARERSKALSKLQKENEDIKQIIKEAYRNERTYIGESVLRQIIDQIWK